MNNTSPGPYFFMSYAQVPPAEGESARGDRMVDTFFADLAKRVGRLANRPSGKVGRYDKTYEPGRDWGTSVGRALGEAQVFVALYSPRYVTGEWTTNERAAFEERVRAADADPAAHIQPVLWMPFPAGTPERAAGAEEIGADIPQYEEMGLGPLCDVVRGEEPGEADTVSEYREAYERIVDRLAHRIVEVAERSPIEPSAVLSPPASGPVLPENADFVIAVFAPTAEQAPTAGDRAAYGDGVLDWSPFARTRPLPVVQQATSVTARLDFTAAVTAARGGRRLWERKPAVLLVDAWLAADRAGSVALGDLLKGLPPWVMPLAIADESAGSDAERAAEALAAAVAMLSDAGADPALAAADGIDRFMGLMPTLVGRARLRFFNAMPGRYPPKPSIRRGSIGRRAVEGDDR